MNTLTRIKNAISSNAATPLPNSGELQAMISGTEEKAGTIDRSITELTAQRATLLVSGSDAEIDAVEAALAAANRDRDRAVARLGELRRLLVDAEAREKAAELDTKYARALEHQEAELRLLKQYDDMASKVAAVLLDIAAHSAERERLNHDLKSGGDNRHAHAGENLAVERRAMITGALTGRVSMPSAADQRVAHWPLSPVAWPEAINAARARLTSTT